jgi:hypothetical protein
VTGAREDGTEEPEPETEWDAEATAEEEEVCETEVSGDDPLDSDSGRTDETVRVDGVGGLRDGAGVVEGMVGGDLMLVETGALPRIALSLCFDMAVERAGRTFSCSSSGNSWTFGRPW